MYLNVVKSVSQRCQVSISTLLSLYLNVIRVASSPLGGIRGGLLFCRNLLQSLFQQFPERSHGRNEATLGCCVRTAQCRTERHHIEVRILAEDDRTLQSGVVNLYNSVFTVQLLIHLKHQVQNLTIWVRVPSTVASCGLNLHSCHIETAL